MPQEKNFHHKDELTMSIKSLIEINRKIYRQNSFWFTLYRGIFSAIGQTIGVVVVLAILIYFLKIIGVFKFLEPYFNNLKM